jgi:alpha-beta hydrolase superfamily lysophospholipase
MTQVTTIRAFYRAVKVKSAPSPYDTLYLKVFYPAQMSGNQLEIDQGIVPADSSQAPFPVVIFFNGINCAAEGYQWLAEKLAQRGLVVVTFNWIAENLPGIVGITPGVDVMMWQPGKYGTAPSATALPALLEELQRLQQEGLLAGMLDLQRVILGGHSAGGRVALENANRRFFPQVAGAFTYGAHSAAPTQLGYDPGTILPLPAEVPTLLLGGTCDGVIANSSFRYGMESDATKAMMRTFSEALNRQENDKYLVLLEGANHFVMVDPFDATTGRAFLDFPLQKPADQIRDLIAEITGLFIQAHILNQPEASSDLQQLLNTENELIASVQCQ